MKAVQYTDHGWPEVIEYGTVPDPDPGLEEALVDVRAGALNHLDVWTRTGLPGLDLALPHVPGSDEKLDDARELGADHAIHYGREDFADAVREATGQRGVDVVVPDSDYP